TFPLLALFFLIACTPSKGLIGNPELPYAPSRPPQIGDLLHMATGLYVTSADMIEAIAESRLIYVGETHDNPASHRFQLEVLSELVSRQPFGVALGMEMFTPEQQGVLDRWSAGELSEKEFLKESAWGKNWQMPYDYYRPLLLYAKEHNIPVVALNAPKSLVKKVGRNNFSELTAEEQALLPEMDMSDPYQRRLVASFFAGHDAGKARQDGFLRVQTLWDEAMSESIVRYLQSPQGKDKQLVVIAGGNHIRYGFGIPRRVFRRLPLSYTLLGSDEIEISAEKKESRLMDVTLPTFPMRPFDYLTYTAYEDLPPHVALGVQLEEEEGKIKIVAILPDSVAASIGLKEGDIVVSGDGERYDEVYDLVYAVRQKEAGESMTLEILRGDKELQIDAHFPRPENSVNE
ncbi:MAG: hypothetical protein C0621_01565, partial [Desulfuromonas sp.]